MGRIDYQTNGLRQTTANYTYDDLNRAYNVHDALDRSTEYEYDLAGRLWRQVDAQGRHTSFGYNQDNSIQTIDYSDPSTPDVAYTYYYDTGMRHTMHDGTGTTTYGYDSLDRLTSVQDGSGKVVSYTLDLADNISILHYPPAHDSSGGTAPRFVLHTYYDNNRLHTAGYNNYGGGAAANFEYDPNGNLTKLTQPGGAWSSFDYDATNVVISTTTRTSTTNLPLVRVLYQRDPIGLVMTDTERVVEGSATMTNTHSYTYDDRNRLRADFFTSCSSNQCTSTSNGWEPDAASQVLTTTSYPMSDPAAAMTTTHSYDDAGQMSNLLEQIGSVITPTQHITYTYGATGNREQELKRAWIPPNVVVYTTTLGYDQANRTSQYTITGPTTYSDVRYRYNGEGLRTLKLDDLYTPAKPYTYTWDISGSGYGLPTMLREDAPVDQVSEIQEMSYVYGLGGMPLFQSSWTYSPLGPGQSGNGSGNGNGNGKESPRAPEAPLFDNTHFYHPDMLGSIRAVTGDNGIVKGIWRYDAYGQQHCTRYEGCDVDPLFGYTGQYTDRESGLLYLRARYYQPATQQFLSRDPLQASTGQPYVYAYGNPVNYTDPAGLAGGSQQQLPPGPLPIEQSNGRWVQPSLPGFWDMMRSVGAGVNNIGNGLEGGFPQGAHPATEGRNYHVAFAMYLRPEEYGTSDDIHYNRANAALHEALRLDPMFAASMEQQIPGVMADVSAKGGRETPTGWTWHHAFEPGRLELVRSSEHWGEFWREMHPGGVGGYSRWAVPAGALPRR